MMIINFSWFITMLHKSNTIGKKGGTSRQSFLDEIIKPILETDTHRVIDIIGEDKTKAKRIFDNYSEETVKNYLAGIVSLDSPLQEVKRIKKGFIKNIDSCVNFRFNLSQVVDDMKQFVENEKDSLLLYMDEKDVEKLLKYDTLDFLSNCLYISIVLGIHKRKIVFSDNFCLKESGGSIDVQKVMQNDNTSGDMLTQSEIFCPMYNALYLEKNINKGDFRGEFDIHFYKVYQVENSQERVECLDNLHSDLLESGVLCLGGWLLEGYKLSESPFSQKHFIVSGGLIYESTRRSIEKIEKLKNVYIGHGWFNYFSDFEISLRKYIKTDIDSLMIRIEVPRQIQSHGLFPFNSKVKFDDIKINFYDYLQLKEYTEFLPIGRGEYYGNYFSEFLRVYIETVAKKIFPDSEIIVYSHISEGNLEYGCQFWCIMGNSDEEDMFRFFELV